MPLYDFHGIRTCAPAMKRLFTQVERVARTDASVLIRGETGTGKELVAQALHRLSPRAEQPFRAVNCATFTAEMLSSELFGHVRGAFTGAVAARPGLFKLADQGSVFLDEVAEIPLAVQAHLLRVLETQSFVPLGGSKATSVNVRVLSATHKALRREVEAHRFRADLQYRVRVVPLFIPPLRERVGDVEALSWLFIADFNRQGFRCIDSIHRDAKKALQTYRWPGNVRELRNVIEYAFAIGAGGELRLADLPPELRGELPPSDDAPLTLEAQTRQTILEALRLTKGRKGDAAKHLGISRSTLWRRMREVGLS